MKRKIFTFVVFLFVFIVLYYFVKVPFSKKHFITIGEASLEVELADTPYLIEKGLMGRQTLLENHGMLFVFPLPARHTFWMKDTLISLSIAFVREDETISQILDMVPDKKNTEHRQYESRENVKYALEVNQGWFVRNRISVGEKVHFSRSIRKVVQR